MHKRLLGLVAVFTAIAVLAVGVATAEQPVTSVKENVHMEFNGGLSSKALAKKRPTPVASWISGRFKTLDGEHVPPLKELLLEGDRNASISVRGIPRCEPGIRSQRFDPAAVRKACKGALVGSGRMEVEVDFEEPENQPPIPASSNLLVFNGGAKEGVTTLYLHAYFTVPTPASVVTVVKAKRIRKGRYGLQATATFPKIAGGSGSVTFFKLSLKKGILSAKCPDGHLAARATARFGDTPPTKLTSAMSRPCTGKS